MSSGLQPGDGQTLKTLGMLVSGLLLIMVVCIGIALLI